MKYKEQSLVPEILCRIKNLSNLKSIDLMVEILYQDLSKSDSNYYYIGIPKDWNGASMQYSFYIVL